MQRDQKQSAYHIVVTRSDRTVWDSGKVRSNQSLNVPYGGATNLTADTSYSWSVRWWDVQGRPSPASSSSFSTGLYEEEDWKGAAWVGGSIGQYRKSFGVSRAVARAVAYVVGLGYYKLHVNGQQASILTLNLTLTHCNPNPKPP